MPVHDWTRVEAGIFHHFHHSWIEEIKRALNASLLPGDYYAMAEQHAAGFGQDAPPRLPLTEESDMEFYYRKQNSIAVRHVSGDRIVAMIEIVSPGNKSGQAALRSFVEKAATLLERQIHLLILDLHPPGARDPQGIHGVIWDDITGQQYAAPRDKPLTLASYETNLGVRAFVQHLAIGDALIEMPLFLKPGGHINVPLEPTYQSAFAALPRRWQAVLEPTSKPDGRA